jgi:hypothetical protein
MTDEYPEATITRFGQGWKVQVGSANAEFIFRNASIAISAPHAEVEVSHYGTHLFRSTSELAIGGRDKLAKTAFEIDKRLLNGSSIPGEDWRLAVFSAVEAMQTAEGSLTGGIDLRFAVAALPSNDMLVSSVFPASNTILVMPNETGKSTIARALALSLTTGKTIIPGCEPQMVGPVLYVAGEDAFSQFHSRALDELARGMKIDHRSAIHPIIMYDTAGRSLARMAAGVAERAVDAAAVILDSHQALLGMANDSGIRDRDSNFWSAVDQIGKPTFTLAHPNRADRLNWNHADGSVAGSDVNQDRARCRWQGRWKDDDDEPMQMFRRRYTLECRKWTHGPRFPSVNFSIDRFKANGTEDWYTSFSESYELSRDGRGDGPNPVGRPPTAFSETVEAYRAGAKTSKELAAALGISQETAKKRLQRFREDLSDDV